jgi:hypothetical protein
MLTQRFLKKKKNREINDILSMKAMRFLALFPFRALVMPFIVLSCGASQIDIAKQVQDVYDNIIQPIKATNNTYHQFENVAHHKESLGDIYASALKQVDLFARGEELRKAYEREASIIHRINQNHVDRARNPLRNFWRLMTGFGLERYDTKEAYKAFQRNNDLQEAMAERIRLKDKILEELQASGKKAKFFDILYTIAAQKGIKLLGNYSIQDEGEVRIRRNFKQVRDIDGKIMRKKETKDEPVTKAEKEALLQELGELAKKQKWNADEYSAVAAAIWGARTRYELEVAEQYMEDCANCHETFLSAKKPIDEGFKKGTISPNDARTRVDQLTREFWECCKTALASYRASLQRNRLAASR